MSGTAHDPSIFRRDDARVLLKGKRIVLIGDSNMRALYKDLIGLIEEGTLGHDDWFKTALPESFKGDELVKTTGLIKGRDYVEERRYTKDGIDIRYSFCTKVWKPNPFLEKLLNRVKNKEERPPHLLAMLCMPWDLSRWGPNGGDNMLASLKDLVPLVKEILKPSTFLWLTYPPLSTEAERGFMLEYTKCLNLAMPIAIIESNTRCARYLHSRNIDVVDIHYELRHFADYLDKDGIHWRPEAIRFMLNRVLEHVCLMWRIRPPGLPKGVMLSEIDERLVQKVFERPRNQAEASRSV